MTPDIAINMFAMFVVILVLAFWAMKGGCR